MEIIKLHGKGNHLIIDGTSLLNLDNESFIKDFLENLVKKIKMRPISEPLVINHIDDKESESGITGTILLAESSIVIHTYPSKKWFCLDIFSCKEFDLNIIKHVKKELKVNNCKSRILKRGFYNGAC